MTTNRKRPTPKKKKGAKARSAEATPAPDPAARQRTIRFRMMFVGLGLGIGMVLAAGRAVTLQTVYASDLRREAARNYVDTVAIDRWRGDITDRNGGLLAVAVHRWAVTADPQRVAEPGRTAEVLAQILGGDAEHYESRLSATTTRRDLRLKHNPVARAARRIVDPAAKAVARAFGFPESRCDRPLGLLEHLYQLEQLRIPGIHKVAITLSDAADAAAEALAADADSLRFFPSRGRRFTYLKRDVDDEAARSIEATRRRFYEHCRQVRAEGASCLNPLDGVRVSTEPKRYYPKRELAAQLVGLVGPDARGISGIELSMDGFLSGGQHRTSTVRDRRGRAMYLEGIDEDAPLAADSVELTIDERIQSVAEREIAQACMVAGARAGFAVVIRIDTGEVLAAADYPAYNPNTYTEMFEERQPLVAERRAHAHARHDLGWAASWAGNARAFPGQEDMMLQSERKALSREYDAFVELEHSHPDPSRASPFLDVYEPGSIMKVFTIAAGIEEGVVDMDYVYNLEGGQLQLNDPDETVIHDSSRHYKGNVAYIMKVSSNIGAAKIGFDLGAERLDHYLRLFGFGQRTGSGFPGEARGLLLPAAEWTVVHLANISFGQGMAATGIQLAAGLAALGNDGKLMKPLLVRRLRDADGKVVREWEPETIRQVVSPRTAHTVLDLMRGVIEPGGTGARAYIAEYPVAGKTGTGQKSHLRKRGYADDMWVNTFFGVAPADDPELAVVVLVDEPKGRHHGGGVFAAPAFQRIMRWTLRYLGVPSPYDTGQQMAWIDPDALAERRSERSETEEAFDHLRPPVDPAEAGDVPVPELRGLTMDRVRRLAGEVGLRVRYLGSGIARTQSVPAHKRVPVGTEITVGFSSRAPIEEQAVEDPTTASSDGAPAIGGNTGSAPAPGGMP